MHHLFSNYTKSAPKEHQRLKNAPKVQLKRCTFGAFAPKQHQKCTWHWCTLGAFAPKEHQNCTSALAEFLEIWKISYNFPNFSKKFPKFFQISSNPGAVLVVWCSFGAKSAKRAPKVHQPKRPFRNFLKKLEIFKKI